MSSSRIGKLDLFLNFRICHLRGPPPRTCGSCSVRSLPRRLRRRSQDSSCLKEYSHVNLCSVHCWLKIFSKILLERDLQSTLSCSLYILNCIKENSSKQYVDLERAESFMLPFRQKNVSKNIIPRRVNIMLPFIYRRKFLKLLYLERATSDSLLCLEKILKLSYLDRAA